MILTIRLQGSLSEICKELGFESETPEELLKEFFDSSNEDLPSILMNEPRAWARTNNILTVKCTATEDEEL